MKRKIKPADLKVHFLNVGNGDSIIIEFPSDAQGKKQIGIVDCYNSTKTLEYLKKIKNYTVDFICATHPHLDHIAGISKLIDVLKPPKFWDCGFRHSSLTYQRILKKIGSKTCKTQMIRITSGMEEYFGKVKITALAPSVVTRNRYDTYGLDINNSSIVLRIEHCKEDAVIVKSHEYTSDYDPEKNAKTNPSVIILGGDAEFDSWAGISQEYPCIIRSSKFKSLVKKMVNPLDCGVIKVSHHGSMHSMPLDVYERMTPLIAVISNEQEESEIKQKNAKYKRQLFPHKITQHTLMESGCLVLTTGAAGTAEGEIGSAGHGTVVVAVGPGQKPGWIQLNDSKDDIPDPPTEVFKEY